MFYGLGCCGKAAAQAELEEMEIQEIEQKIASRARKVVPLSKHQPFCESNVWITILD